MLIVSRKCGQSIQIGEDIEIVVAQTSNGKVRIGINAPRYISVRRGELPRSGEYEDKSSQPEFLGVDGF